MQCRASSIANVPIPIRAEPRHVDAKEKIFYMTKRERERERKRLWVRRKFISFFFERRKRIKRIARATRSRASRRSFGPSPLTTTVCKNYGRMLAVNTRTGGEECRSLTPSRCQNFQFIYSFTLFSGFGYDVSYVSGRKARVRCMALIRGERSVTNCAGGE